MGRTGNAHRHQLRPLPLPYLRRGTRDRSDERRDRPGAFTNARPRASVRRAANQRAPHGGPPARTASGASRPAQLGRYRRGQIPRGRLRVVRLQRGSGVTEFDLGSAVLAIARSAIAEKLALSVPLDGRSDARLDEWSATFVTLKQAGGLRGCV